MPKTMLGGATPNGGAPKPVTRKYHPEQAFPVGMDPLFHDAPSSRKGEFGEATGEERWKNYLGWLEKKRRDIAPSLAAARRDPPPSEKQQTEMSVLAHVAQELGVPAPFTYDQNTQLSGGYGTRQYPYCSTNNPWLDLPPAQRRQDVQQLLTRISKLLHPDQPPQPGSGGNDKGKEKSKEEHKESGKGGGESKEKQRPGKSEESETRKERREEKYEAPPPKRSTKPHSGGGEQFYSDHKQESIFLSIRRLLSKLAEHRDYSQTLETGLDRWDARQLLTARWNPTRLPTAKRDYATRIDDIYLSLDTSGSVNHLTSEIASMAAGAAGVVHLYTGTEGRPEMWVPRSTPLSSPSAPFPEWHAQRNMAEDTTRFNRWTRMFMRKWGPLYPTLAANSFELRLGWMLEREKPRPGSRLLFWGDTEGVGFMAPRLLAHLVRPYRFAWLYPYPDRPLSQLDYHYHSRLVDDPEWVIRHADQCLGIEYPKLRLVGLPVLFEVADAIGIQRAMRDLQTRH